MPFYKKPKNEIQSSISSAGSNAITALSSVLGEANTASNLGGANQLFNSKVGVDLQFKTISAGTNITIISGATVLTINSTATGGSGSSSSDSYWVSGTGINSLMVINSSTNIAGGDYSFVVGKNSIGNGISNSILNGNLNRILDSNPYGTIINGANNTIQGTGGYYSSIINGRYNNIVASNYSFIAGANNYISNSSVGTIFSQGGKIVSSIYSSIIGGNGNYIKNASYSTILGTKNKTLTQSYTVLVPRLRISTLPTITGTTKLLTVNTTGDVYQATLSAGTGIQIVQSSSSSAITISLTASTAGEINTASNLTGGTGIFNSKVGVDLQFNSLSAGTNINITTGATVICINSTTSGSGGGVTINNGTNTFTAGTSTFQSVNLTAATINFVIASGTTSRFNVLSANTFSASTVTVRGIPVVDTGIMYVRSAGLAGGGADYGARFDNLNTSTGTNPFYGTSNGNWALFGFSNGSTTGVNIGLGGVAANSSNVNIGIFGDGTGNVNSEKFIGTSGFALVPTGGVGVAGYFGLHQSLPNLNSAAVIADNGANAVDIFVGRDNTIDVFKVKDGGSLLIKDGTQGLGKVLTSDASGNTSWTNPSGLSFADSFWEFSGGTNSFQSKNGSHSIVTGTYDIIAGGFNNEINAGAGSNNAILGGSDNLIRGDDPVYNSVIAGGSGLTLNQSQTLGTQRFRFNGSMQSQTKVVTTADSPYQITLDDYALFIDTTDGDLTLLTPEPPVSGMTLYLKKIVKDSNIITLDASAGTSTIEDGSSSSPTRQIIDPITPDRYLCTQIMYLASKDIWYFMSDYYFT